MQSQAVDSITTGSEDAVHDDRGVNLALLAALPAAKSVLEFGCATGALGRRYKSVHPAAVWTGVDVNDASLAAARPHLDRVHQIDLDVDSIASVGSGFDLIVLGDVLEHLKQPEALLRDLLGVCAQDARLVCCIPNMSHISVIERLVRGDIMYDQAGLLDATHLRFFAPRSAYKMLLDAGWLPNAAGGYQGGHTNAQFVKAIVDAALALGIPPSSAELNVFTYQLVISCERRRALPVSRTSGKLSVIVPVHDYGQFDLNVLRSPGLREIGAEIIVCRDAASAAVAYATGVARASADWLLVCDEDVYFPRGTGCELLDVLDRIPPGDASSTLIGFAGVGIDEALRPFRAGLMVDGRALRDFPATDRAISISDCAVVLHRDNRLAIDPALDRNLWATDLCLQSIHGVTARLPQIVRIPVFHNSVDDGSLRSGYAESAKILARKYAGLPSIVTLDADIRSGGALYAPSFVEHRPAES